MYMRILIDDGMQVEVKTGIGNYTQYLYNNLKKNKKIQKVDLLKTRNISKCKFFGRLRYLYYINSKKYRNLTSKYSIIHYTNYAIPFFRNKNTKYVVTVHDLAAVLYSNTLPFLYRIYSKFILRYTIKHSDLIFTVSNSVKEELKRYFPKEVHKVVVGYPGLYETEEISNNKCSNIYHNDILNQLEKKKFFLYVGTIEMRKNISLILNAFLNVKKKYKEASEYKLVLAGRPGYGYDEFVEIVNNSSYADDVIFSGYVNNSDCNKLYKDSAAYIFATIYEGFGSTQLECMKHHTPLILSDIPTNLEVSGEYGLFFNVNNQGSLEQQIKKIIMGKYDEKKHNKIADKISKKFTWNNVIDDYIAGYHKVSKIKICHVIGDFINGGVESVIYNYFSHLDLNKFDVHIIGHGITVYDCYKKFVDLGFTIHNITPKRINLLKNLREMNSIIKKYNYDILHSHLTEWACIPMILGFLNNISVRINHSHMAEKPKGIKNKIYYGIRLWLGKIFATDYFACGRDAGIYLFGKKALNNGKVTVLNNAVDVSKFSYNEKIRYDVKKQNKINNNEIIIGHVGRFFEQKNHKFLIKIFKELSLTNDDVRLYLFGDGELLDSIKSYVNELDLSNKVVFMGVRQDIDKWYQVMDAFVLPSLYEGLPVVGIEAQMSGLPCFFSDTITKEILVNKNSKFISLETSASEWAKQINKKLSNFSRNSELEYSDKYNILKQAEVLEKFYVLRVKKR